MDKVYKWVEKFEATPTAYTVSNAKKKLDATRFHKFMELTGYEYRDQHPKCDRRLQLEQMTPGEEVPVGKLKQDQNLTAAIQKADGSLFYIHEKKTVRRLK